MLGIHKVLCLVPSPTKAPLLFFHLVIIYSDMGHSLQLFSISAEKVLYDSTATYHQFWSVRSLLSVKLSVFVECAFLAQFLFLLLCYSNPNESNLRENSLILSQNSWWGVQGNRILKQLIMQYPQEGGNKGILSP